MREGVLPANPRADEQQGHVAVVGAAPAQLTLERVHLPVELVDQAQARLDVATPGLEQRHRRQQCSAVAAEQIADRTGEAMTRERGVDAVLQLRSLLDQ